MSQSNKNTLLYTLYVYISQVKSQTKESKSSVYLIPAFRDFLLKTINLDPNLEVTLNFLDSSIDELEKIERERILTALFNSMDGNHASLETDNLIKQKKELLNIVHKFSGEFDLCRRLLDFLRSAQSLELADYVEKIVVESLLQERPIFLPAVPPQPLNISDIFVYGKPTLYENMKCRIQDYDTIFSRASENNKKYWIALKHIHAKYLNILGMDE